MKSASNKGLRKKQFFIFSNLSKMEMLKPLSDKGFMNVRFETLIPIGFRRLG
jgi:hypothetical protein